MPFVANTPESLVARSDSKNPATTCRGLTSAGRPCRRPLSAADAEAVAAHYGRRRKKLHVDDPTDERLYCWQHKDQASVSAQSSPGPKTSGNSGLGQRTSIDTLTDRLGLLDVNSTNGSPGGQAGPRPQPPTQRKKKHHLWLCCFRIPLDSDFLSTPAPRPSPQQPQMAAAGPPATPLSNLYSSSGGNSSPGDGGKKQQHLQAHQSPSSHKKHHKRKSSASTTSQTQYLSLIPASASPQTASTLMAELAKPISQLDEAGYIYMFWLTPESEPSTPIDAARSLLSPSSLSPDGRQRRGSDVFSSFAAAAAGTRSMGNSNGNNGNKTILLKIGRANNVQRRLNEWKRQCGYNLSLIRFYPYISSSGTPNGGGSGVQGGPIPRKMPHSHKVERLIHLELAGAGLRITDAEKCQVCGREHREWFQVEASRDAVMRVDETIRRWADWDEGQA